MFYQNDRLIYTKTIEERGKLMNSQKESIGNRIYLLRTSRNMTREALAEKADISVQFLSDIEKGKKSMTVNTLKNISNALSVTPDYIITGNPESDTCNEISSIIGTLNEEQKKTIRDVILLIIESWKK